MECREEKPYFTRYVRSMMTLTNSAFILFGLCSRSSTPFSIGFPTKKLQNTSRNCESEYIAASEAAMEAVWIRKFISGLGIVPTINEPLNMYCDNSAAVHYANGTGVQKGKVARH
ncbi:hypothetical protein Tco_1428254 [Tanacetum coccineum]